jgi:hypothetical protein
MTLFCRKTEPETIVLDNDSNFELQFNVQKDGISPIESVEVVVRIPFADAKGNKFLTFNSFKVRKINLKPNINFALETELFVYDR